MRTISNLLSAMFVIFFTYYLINNPEVFDVFSKKDSLIRFGEQKPRKNRS